MDYFFMSDYTFKIIIKTNKKFIINMLKTIGINIKDYELFEINENTKQDILLFTENLVINIELNKNKKSLIRNKIYIDCISKILKDYKIIQININLFKEINEIYNNIKIYNLFNDNEYIKFITSKKPFTYQTKNKEINKVIKYLNYNNELDKLKPQIIKQEKLKENIDNLIQE